jgi:serine/threonine-protein kinase HipA
MAQLLWGKVYLHDSFAGYLREELGNSCSFTYDERYLESGKQPIAYTLPLQQEPHISQTGLHPFFDNLVAEGWLEKAQGRLLGKRQEQISRLELLLAFGYDCIGAVSVIDPNPSKLTDSLLNRQDPKETALLTAKASLSGVQPKLAVIFDAELDCYRPTVQGEISTHIAKFISAGHNELVANEYLATQAFKALLPDDEVVEMQIGHIQNIDEPALLIKRFDRATTNRIHFEEFNQLLNRAANDKYSGSHQEMGDFINQTDGRLPSQVFLLYSRILAGFLIGNTDMHLKNFAMFKGQDGNIRLTSTYDMVCASIYDYKTIALEIGRTKDLAITQLKPANIIKLGEEFSLNAKTIAMAVNGLMKNLESAKKAILNSEIGSDKLKQQLVIFIEKRWNTAFALIGHTLSKKQ